MLLLLACASKSVDTGRESAPLDDTAVDTEESVPGDDTATDTQESADTADTAVPPCTSTCDCGDGELCYDGTCANAGPALDAYRVTLDRMLADMDPTTGEFPTENAYPTEAMMTFASGADLLCDSTLADAATTRAAFARSAETTDHFYVQPGYGTIYRDIHARHIYNLWAAGHALGDTTLLQAADDAAAAMLTLERVTYKDEWTLFCVAYSTNSGHLCDNGYTWIDVNQNSEIGLVFALLATDPESALYEDPLALDVVAQELGAALSMQTAAGEIPIGSEGERAEQYDTLYGSYAAWSWVNAEPLGLDPSLTDGVALAAAWLGPLSDGSPESHRYYPSTYDGDISLSEGAMRIPVLSRAGSLDPAFVAYYWSVTVPKDTETETVWMPWWLPLHQGLPLSELFPPD